MAYIFILASTWQIRSLVTDEILCHYGYILHLQKVLVLLMNNNYRTVFVVE